MSRHDRMMQEERLQAERVRSDQADTDIWRPNARRFRPEADVLDPSVEVLVELAGEDGRVIDVGAGGGRITIPLAQRVREVVAVEPSPAMREVLEAGIVSQGVTNLRIVPDRWEDADVEPAELVFAAHVTYGVPDIEPFLRKMDRLATKRAALVTFGDPPQHVIAPFWRYVYGEERLRLPCRDELIDVLRELGADPRVIDLPPQEPRSFGTFDEAVAELRRRLFIGTNTSAEILLREAIGELTIERDGELWPKHAKPNARSVVWWESGRLKPGATA